MLTYQGRVIVPDEGFYVRDFLYFPHSTKSAYPRRQFVRGTRTRLTRAVLSIEDQEGHGCLFEDAEVLAKYVGLIPGRGNHTTLVHDAMSA
jgi:hypothetical protein